MTIVFIVAIISILLESAMSNIIPIYSIFTPLYTITSLIIIYPYFNNKDNQYIKACGLIGLIYDVVFTNTLFLNMTLFIIVGLLIKMINVTLTNNFINVMIMTIISITTYLILTYITLYIISYKQFNINYLIKVISSSYISNIIYALLLYLITDNLSSRHKIPKID